MRFSTPFTMFVKKLAWYIADEGVLLFSTENLVAVAATHVNFAVKDGDVVALILAEWSFPPQTLHTYPGHRIVLWPFTPQRLHLALPSLPPSTFLSQALLLLVWTSFFSQLFSPPFPYRPPRPTSAPTTTIFRASRGNTAPGLPGTFSISNKRVISIPSSSPLILLTLEMIVPRTDYQQDLTPVKSLFSAARTFLHFK